MTPNLVIANAQAAYELNYDVVITNACGSLTSTPATLALAVPTTASGPSSLTRCPGQSADFSASGLGTGPFTYQWGMNGADIPGATGPTLSIASVTPADAGTYYVVVTGACNSVTNCATLTVDVPTTAIGPTGVTVCQGADASFSTAASGTGPFNYQWTLDGAPVGSNAPALTANTGSLSAGSHTVRVILTGQCGSATNSANLTVQPLTSAIGPDDENACHGQDVTLETVAGGVGPFDYQWRLDGGPVGTNGPSLTLLSSALALRANVVEVVVTGQCGPAVTNTATITVQNAFASEGPDDTAVCQGIDASFRTEPSGSPPFNFQWSLDRTMCGWAGRGDQYRHPDGAGRHGGDRSGRGDRMRGGRGELFDRSQRDPTLQL